MNRNLTVIINTEFYPVRFWGDTDVTLLEIDANIIYQYGVMPSNY